MHDGVCGHNFYHAFYGKLLHQARYARGIGGITCIAQSGWWDGSQLIDRKIGGAA
jgi:hypothetical protein